MCTVIVRVPEDPAAPARMIAVRDEDPARAWDPLGVWWPSTYPGVTGVRDARAGGAWLAALPTAGRLAVLLNVGGPAPQPGLASRGEVVLDAVANRPLPPRRRTQPYSLVTVDSPRTCLTLSDGLALDMHPVRSGVHMLVNSPALDDTSFARVARWLPAFRAATPADDADDWFAGWLEVMAASAGLPSTDDEAIIRDNRPYGIGTLSLLMCQATIGHDFVDLEYVEFGRPGEWSSRTRPIRR